MHNRTSSLLYAASPLVPSAALLLAALLGGTWVWGAFATMTALVLLLDRLLPDLQAPPDLAKWLPWTVGAAHFAALAACLWAVGNNPLLDTGEKILLVVTIGLFAGQVSNACAHELIHRPTHAARRFGTAIYCSLLNGQHVSAHLLLHHVHAATAHDPNSAPAGQGFYRFLLHAARSEIVDGFRAEAARRPGGTILQNPYSLYAAGALSILGFAFWIGGGVALVALIALSAHSQAQLLLSDYVQHYGLRRQLGPDGKPEPMGPQHSWNAPHAFSGALMLNAPIHSAHHMHPARAFPDLSLHGPDTPILPYSLPVMGAIALIPPLWRRVMAPRLNQYAPNTAPAKLSNRPSASPLLSQ